MMLPFSLVMQGYDAILAHAFFSLPQFRQRYGERVGDNVTVPWDHVTGPLISQFALERTSPRPAFGLESFPNNLLVVAVVSRFCCNKPWWPPRISNPDASVRDPFPSAHARINATSKNPLFYSFLGHFQQRSHTTREWGLSGDPGHRWRRLSKKEAARKTPIKRGSARLFRS